MCTIVPLEISVMQGGGKIIFWKNLSTSSTKYCRPLSFRIKKETEVNIKNEVAIVERQIAKLRKTTIDQLSGLKKTVLIIFSYLQCLTAKQ